jgi:hypothetical protein
VDRLNTHSPAALYAAFPPTAAKRLADRLEIHHTPKHGSRLTMAELELSAPARQCLAQRFGEREAMVQAATAWADRRNAADSAIDWRITSADARTRLRRPYPALED